MYHCRVCAKAFIPQNMRGPVPSKCQECSPYSSAGNICQYCGGPNKAAPSNRYKYGVRFCSKECYSLSTRTLKNKVSECFKCKKQYTPKAKGSKYCSRTCANRSTHLFGTIRRQTFFTTKATIFFSSSVKLGTPLTVPEPDLTEWPWNTTTDFAFRIR